MCRAFPTTAGRSHNTARSNGFTMIEVLAVLLVLAVVMTVILNRTPSIDRDAYAQAAILRSHLRFAQSMAMANTMERWGISFTPHSYTLIVNGGPSAVPFPNDKAATHNLPDGVTLSTGINQVLFDAWGSPGPDTVTIALNSESITITGITGFIP